MARKFRIVILVLLLTAVLTTVLSACGQEEEGDLLPTLVPTAEILPTATALPTAVPQLDADQIDWPPQLLFRTPAEGEIVQVHEPITIRFDQSMDHASVEAALSFTQRADGEAIAGRYEWPRPDTVQFIPTEPLARNEQYVVQIADTAVSTNGLTLAETIQYQLNSAGFLEVTQVVPSPNSNDVLTDTPITLFFNQPVVPLTSTDQQDNLPQPLTFDPSVAGEGIWLSTSIYQFTPEQPLAGATSYSVTVSADLDEALAAPFSWQFNTISPRLLSATPNDGSRLVRPDAPLMLTFNMPMNQEATETAVQLSGGDTPPMEADWSEDGTTLTLTPESPLDLGTTYQLTVGSGATASTADVPLRETAVVSFTTVPLPAVLGTQPTNGATADRFQRGFVIRFASPMELETLEGQILINPTPEGQINYFFNEFSNELNVDFTYQPSTRYAITVPRSAADPYGNILGDSYEFVFNAPPRPPILSFNLPANIAQLSSSFQSRVELVHVNIDEANFALYDVGLPMGLLSRPFEVNEYRPATNPLRTWTAEFDTEQDEAGVVAISLVESGALPNGIYLLTANSDDLLDENDRFWQNQRQLLIVADTNLVVKEMVDSIHIWATDIRTGEPVSALGLSLFDSQGVQMGSALSDSNGFATIDKNRPSNFLDGVTVMSNQPGEAGFGLGNSNWQSGAEPWSFELNYNPSPEPESFIYLYSDRPIYRPGDTVYFKGIARTTDYGRYTLPTPQTVNVHLRYQGFIEGRQIDEQIEVSVGEDGTFNGEYIVSADAPLGNYTISVEEPNFYTGHSLTIAEYRRPELIVEFETSQAESLRGEAVSIDVTASTFFGAPSANLPVRWSVRTRPFFFTPEGPFFNYGDAANFLFEDEGRFFGGGFNEQLLLEGEGMTDENGRFTITLPADLLAERDPGSHDVIIEATVTDLSNFSVSNRLEYTLHAADLYVGIKPNSPILQAGNAGEVVVRATDWDGTAVANQSIEVVFYQREWNAVREQDEAGTYTRWVAEDDEVARQTVTTNQQGEATASFVPEEGGTYIAVATITDSGGRENFSSTALWVYDSGRIGWRLDPEAKRLNLIANQSEYSVGDTAEILIQSPFNQPVNAWLTIERGDLISQELITVDGSSDLLTLPITAEFAPNVFVSITAVKPVTPDGGQNPQADIRLGIVELVVDPAQFNLTIEMTPQEPNMEPGETAVFDIQVTDASGNPVSADLSLALVDKAILTLKEDTAQPILEAFYQRQPLRSQTGAGLFISGENLTVEVPVEVLGRGGGGGAESVTDQSVALRDGADGETDDARSEFPDTAYWQANISTNASGQATVEIELPDTLTTWVLLSKAATDDTQVGEATAELVTSLPLLVRPVTPRFMTVGDEMLIGAIVNNNTNEVLETAVSLTVEGVDLLDTASQEITIPANGQQLVQWRIRVPDSPFADLTFRAESGDLVDVTKPSFGIGDGNVIPIVRYTARDIVATAGVLDEAGRQVEAIWLAETLDDAQGSVNVQLDTSLVGTLWAVVEDLANEDMRTSCAVSVADALLPRLVAGQISDQLEIEPPDGVGEIEQLLSQLLGFQQSDGGFSWCSGGQSDPFFTAQIVLTLVQADEAGYRVPAERLTTAVSYLQSQTAPPQSLTEPFEINRQLFMLYAQSLVRPVNETLLADHFDLHFELLLPESRALMALILHNQEILPDTLETLLSTLNSTAVLSATGAHWETATGWAQVQTDVRNTAVVLSALSQIEPDNELLVPTVRWLMSARQAVRWATIHDTAWVTLALFNWADASGDIDADFEYRVLVDLAPQLEQSAASATAAETSTLNLPISEFALGEAHFVELQREAGDGNLYYSIFLDVALNAADALPLNRGLQIERTYFDAACDPATNDCQPITAVSAGQQVRVELTIVAENDLVYAVIDDPIPAGTEAIDNNLETTSIEFGASVNRPDLYQRGYWGYWFFNQIAFQDDRVTFSSDFLPAGTYQYTYFLQATIPGSYQVMPTFGRQLFMPEVNGRSAGMLFTVLDE